MLSEEQDRVNVYGVVLDSSAPYYMSSAGKYICTMKLIDPTVHPRGGGKSAAEYLSTTFFAATSGELPSITKVGSIMRIHRGQTKDHKGHMQLNCDVIIKGAWVVFDPSESLVPLGHSGKRHTFEPADRERLKEVRKFGKTFFAAYALAGSSLREAAERRPTDFDTICLVLDVRRKGDVDRVRLCDAEKVVKLDLPIQRGVVLKPQDVVRLRSANYVEGSHFLRLSFAEYSHVLKLSREQRSAEQLFRSLEDKSVAPDVKAQLQLYKREDGKSVLATSVLKSHRADPVMSLRALIADSGSAEQRRHRIQAHVIEFGPKEPRDWLWVFDPHTQKQYLSHAPVGTDSTRSSISPTKPSSCPPTCASITSCSCS